MTMKNSAPETKKVQSTAKQPTKQTSAKRRKRSRGVPAALVAVLLVLVLFFGGLLGFIVANKTNRYAAELAEARERIDSLENYLTMMGFSQEESDPETWIFDDSGDIDEFEDLSGGFDDGDEAVWDDGGMLEGMLVLEGDPVVVAEFNGGTLMSDEVVEPYNDALATQIFGFSDAEDVSGDVLSEVMASLVADKVLYARAEELGLTTLTDADIAKIEAEAQYYYDEQKDFYASSVDTEGMTPEEAQQALDAYMASDVGVTLEGLIEEQKSEYWIQKLYDYVGGSVTVAEDELQAAYDQRLADQKALFAEYPEEYEYAIMSGQPILYNLEGYRRVKHVMLAFEDYDAAAQVEELTYEIAMLDPETQMDQILGLQDQLDVLYASLEEQAQSIIAEINAGADFDAMIDKYGMDESMEFEPVRTNGFYVAPGSIQWAEDFIEGCMMLEEIGQVSAPVRSISGVHIIKYVGDVTPGEVSLAEIRDQLLQEVIAEKQELAYEEQVAQWLAEAAPTYYPERLQ